MISQHHYLLTFTCSRLDKVTDKDGSIKQNYSPRSRFINLMVRDEHGNMVQVQGGGEPPLTTAALVECEENGM